MKSRSEHLMRIHALVQALGEILTETDREQALGRGALHCLTTQIEARALKRQAQRKAAAWVQVKKALKREIQEKREAQEESRSQRDRLQFLASELSLSEERERRRIASAVHDSIGQNLAVAKIRMEALRKKVDPALELELKHIQEFIEQSIQDTRCIIMELSPPVLYELGLVPALHWLAEDIRLRHGISADFDHEGIPEIARDLQVLLFQMTRELVWNVVKHARARNVRIFLRSGSEKIQIAVEDDGIGFEAPPPDIAPKPGGFGLFSIRERLRPFGGNLHIQSAPGEGTKATITFRVQRSEF